MDMDNDNNKTYITILADTLRKKEAVLRKLAEATTRQTGLLDQEEMDVDAFNSLVDEKEKLLEQLNSLDEGFLDLYEKVREELRKNASAYSGQVKEIQELVRTQTELSTSLMAAEERNRNRMTVQMSHSRQKVKEFHVNSKTAAAYYKNMSGRHQDGDSYFFNRKK